MRKTIQGTSHLQFLGRDGEDQALVDQLLRLRRIRQVSSAHAPETHVGGVDQLRQLRLEVERYRNYRSTFYSRLAPNDQFIQTLNRHPTGSNRSAAFAKEVPDTTPGKYGDGSLATNPTKKFGLNQILPYEYEDGPGGATTKYGDGPGQLTDAKALGASFIRQHGQRDLLWGTLTSTTTSIPRSAGLAALINSPTNVARVSELFGELIANEIKVRFTFLTLGGGGSNTIYSDPIGQFEDGSVSDQRWSSAHLDKSADGYEFNYLDGYLDPGDSADNWYLDSLDLRSGYKRYYLSLIAAEVATLLNSAISTFPGRVLGDVIDGIEIFNEVELRNHILVGGSVSWPYTALYWAWAYKSCAEAFYANLSSTVPILLPGLSSYNDAAPGKRWSDKIEYLDKFLTFLEGYASALDLPIQTIASGIDYHWYHRATDEHRHIGYLLAEVDELKTLLVGHGIADPTLTVFEGGVAVESDFVPVLMADGVPTATTIDPDHFQAHEVWRRLGGALASHASIAGWHDWMSRDIATTMGSFALMGLREDGGVNTDPASAATPRYSYYAFQRLASRLSRVVSGRMRLPIATSRSALDAASADDYLVVFEYDLEPGHVHSYAYLFFYDPCGPANGAHVTASGTSDWVPTALLVETVPYRPSASYGGGSLTLPTGSGAFHYDSTISLPTTFKVYRADPPVLILSRGPISWGYVDAFLGD